MAERQGPAPRLLLDIGWSADVIEWRGPSPYHFVAVPEARTGKVRFAARSTSYGWGVAPVEAAINDIAFRTSLFPRDGGYLLPLKNEVRRRADIGPGERIRAEMRIAEPGHDG